VTILVAPSAIVAVGDSGMINGFVGNPSLLSVLSNDSLNGAVLNPALVTIGLITTPATGITLNTTTGAVGVSAGTPAGVYSFIYQICEVLNPTNCDTAIVIVHVFALGPVANPDSTGTNQGVPVTLNPLINDTDPDGNLNPGSVAIVGGPSNGTAIVNPITGVITYTPNASYFGRDTIFYMVCDSGMVPVLCDTSYIVITVVEQLQIVLLSQTNVLCFGDATGEVSIQLQGGMPPYQIVWNTSPAINGATAANLPAGNYVVTVTDALNNQRTLNVTITQPLAPMTAAHTSVEPECWSENNGSIVVQVQGGTAPYSYLWSNGDITNAPQNLVAGTYQVSITDANGCTFVYNVILGQPDVLTIYSVDIDEVKCKNDPRGAIRPWIVGGTSPYSYIWSTGDTTATISGVKGGAYQFHVTDANGCTWSSDFVIPYEVERCEEILKIPSGISPDGDGFNDAFVIEGIEDFPNNIVRIYNRWGSLVYEAYGYRNEWYGQVNRGLMLSEVDGILPSGTYFFVIKLDEGIPERSGYVYISK
jgi:gliding motility-associated-like protein